MSGITRWNETSGVRDVRSKNGFGPDLSDMTDRTGIVLLASIGTFKIDGICWYDDNNTYAATFLETTEDGAVPAAYGHLLNVSDGPLELSGSASDYSLQSSVVGGGFLAANAARSLFIQGSYDQAVYPLQPSDSVRTCRFAGFVVRSP